MLEKIVQELQQIKGLKVHAVLSKKTRDRIIQDEEQHNIGVRETLTRQILLLVTHDDEFRKPLGEQVQFTEKKHHFPGLPFPEVKAHNVVSASPSLKIHNMLIEAYSIKHTARDASLLIGFDLEQQ